MANPSTLVPAGKVRLTVDLPEVDVKALHELALKKDIPLTEALSFAISRQKQLADVQLDGDNLLLERNGSLSKLSFLGNP